MMSLLFSAQRLWTLVGLLGLGKIVADSHFLISFLSILPLLAFSSLSSTFFPFFLSCTLSQALRQGLDMRYITVSLPTMALLLEESSVDL